MPVDPKNPTLPELAGSAVPEFAIPVPFLKQLKQAELEATVSRLEARMAELEADVAVLQAELDYANFLAGRDVLRGVIVCPADAPLESLAQRLRRKTWHTEWGRPAWHAVVGYLPVRLGEGE